MDNRDYVRVPAINRKLREAEKENRTIIVSSPVGFGKTAAVQYFYRRKSALWLTGASCALSEMPAIGEIKQSTVIIDDVQWITDDESKEYIGRLIDDGRCHVVLISRSKLPKWLKPAFVMYKFHTADEKDLALDTDAAAKLLANFNVELPHEQVMRIVRDTAGHALSIVMIALNMQNKSEYNQDIKETARIDVYHYYDKTLYDMWPKDMIELFEAVSPFEKFSIELAEYITEKPGAMAIIDQAMSIGDFLTVDAERNFRMRNMLQDYLQWKIKTIDSGEMIIVAYRRAAEYFEEHEMTGDALEYYSKAGCHDKVSEILIKNGIRHPGVGHFIEFRKYYQGLPEAELLSHPELMSAMSMICSLTLQPEESEKWYERLEQYEKACTKGSHDKTAAKSLLVYLDVALPHRGTSGLTDVIIKAAKLKAMSNVKIPEFSLTGNQPSIMNGSKDFSEWSRHDSEFAVFMKKPVETMLGKSSAGLVDISLAESWFEKGSADSSKLTAMLNRGYMNAEAAGNIEMCFTAIGIMTRLSIVKGQIDFARIQLEEFREKVESEGADRLLPNLDAMVAWIDLLYGRTDRAKLWLSEKAPNENIGFCTLYRYMYLIKLRIYIALGMMDEALRLSERLSVYFQGYYRTLMRIENDFLKAILQYRLGQKTWQTTFMKAVNDADSYGFRFVMCKEGAALLPLAENFFAKEQKACTADSERMLEDLKSMASYYPNYLKEIKKADGADTLTQMEKKILTLYCSGADTEEVCKACAFTYNTLKYHNRNIYRKLGVNSRIEAERKAVTLAWMTKNLQ